MTRAISLLLALGFASAGAAAGAEGGTAEGTLTVGDRTVTLRHAAVREYEPNGLEVTLSDVPLDGRLLRDSADLVALAKEGRASALRITVRLPEGGASLVEVFDRGVRNGEVGSPQVGTFTASVATSALVEGSVSSDGVKRRGGTTIAYTARFRATPPGGAPRSLDDLLDGHAGVRARLDRITEGLVRHALAIVWGVFFLLVGAALLWGLVLAPAKAREVLRGLEARGYSPVDRKDPELLRALVELAPFSMRGTVSPDLRDFSRHVLSAVARGGRFVVNVSQRFETRGYRSRVRVEWETIVVDPAALSSGEKLHVRARSSDRPWTPDRLAKFGLAEAPADALDPAFRRLFAVATKGGVRAEVPERLQRALLGLERYLVRPERFSRDALRSDLLRDVGMKFTPAGFGIRASGVWLDPAALDALVAVADGLAGQRPADSSFTSRS